MSLRKGAVSTEKRSVSVIATSSNTVVGGPITVGSDAVGVAITPNGKFAYVTSSPDNTVSVIGTGSNRVVATIPVGSGPFDVGITHH